MPSGVQSDISKDVLRGVILTSLIFFMSNYLPVFGFFSSLIMPLPILFYRVKLGRKDAALIPVISLMIMAVMLGKVCFNLYFFAGLLLLGFSLGDMLEQDFSIEKTVLYTCGIVLGGELLCLIFYSNAVNIGPVSLVSEHVAENLKMVMVLYEKMGVSGENLQMLSELQDIIHYALLRIIPSMIVSSVIFITWMTILMAKPILKSQGLFFPDFGSLNLWKVPEFLVWGVIGCSIMLMIPDAGIRMFGFNGLIIFMTIYFLGGIAIISYYFEKKQFPLMLRLFLYSLIAIWQLMLFLVIGLGFFDMWLNFRKLETEKE
mgnify:CR=1 FL=1